MQRVINIWEIRKPYNQNIILQIVLNTEEEYVQAGLLQTFYFPLKIKKKKKPKKTTDMSMVEWVGLPVKWIILFIQFYESLTSSMPIITICCNGTPVCHAVQFYKDLLVFWGCKSLLGTQIAMQVPSSPYTCGLGELIKKF